MKDLILSDLKLQTFVTQKSLSFNSGQNRENSTHSADLSNRIGYTLSQLVVVYTHSKDKNRMKNEVFESLFNVCTFVGIVAAPFLGLQSYYSTCVRWAVLSVCFHMSTRGVARPVVEGGYNGWDFDRCRQANSVVFLCHIPTGGGGAKWPKADQKLKKISPQILPMIFVMAFLSIE